jgi:hypothetical protein
MGATMNADLDKGGLLQAVKGADECWLAQETASVGGLQEAVHVAATPGSRTLYVARQREGATPGVVVSEQGKGRVAYLCGWSSEYAFSRLVRRAVFWVARREADFDRLDVTGGEDLFIYAYPAEHLLAVASNAKVPANARLRLDPAILQANKGPGAKRAIYDLRLVDITTEQKIWEGDAKELAEGVSIGTVPRCVRLLRLE